MVCLLNAVVYVACFGYQNKQLVDRNQVLLIRLSDPLSKNWKNHLQVAKIVAPS